MRPTIPLLEWRIAVDLEKTADLQDLPGPPGRGCDCEWCCNWRACFREALPSDLCRQLERLRLRLESPSELYARSEVGDGFEYRVSFHCVGKLLGGPAPHTEAPGVAGSLGAARQFRKVPGGYGSIAAWVGTEPILGALPTWTPDWAAPLVLVDLLVDVPWVIKAAKPATHWAP